MADAPTEQEWRAMRYSQTFIISAEARVLADGRTAIRLRLGAARQPVATGWSVVPSGGRATIEEALVALLEAVRAGDGAVVVRGGDPLGAEVPRG